MRLDVQTEVQVALVWRCGRLVRLLMQPSGAVPVVHRCRPLGPLEAAGRGEERLQARPLRKIFALALDRLVGGLGRLRCWLLLVRLMQSAAVEGRRHGAALRRMTSSTVVWVEIGKECLEAGPLLELLGQIDRRRRYRLRHGLRF